MNKEHIPVITDREELYDKCENMEQLYDKYYLPLLDIHYRKTYELQQENQELKKQLEEYKRLGFKHLQNRCNELEKQLEVGEQQYNDLVEEKEELQEQLSIKTLQFEEYKHKGLYNTCLPYRTGYKKAIKEKENQQKEFIEYLENYIKEMSIQNINSHPSRQIILEGIIDTLKVNLSKFKEIIGGKDEELSKNSR